MRQEPSAAPCLFGWHLIDPKARVVTITEGEIDAMTLHQMRVPALSVNQGAGNHQWIEVDWEKLERFDEILVCFDNDEAGDKGASEVIKRLGVERCRRVRLGAKDANQWLQDGAEAVDFQQAMIDARPLDPDELRNADDYTAAVEDLFYPPPGTPLDPALYIDKELDWFRFRLAEYTCWTGINGHGKSLMLDQILLGLMLQGERIVIFSGEMGAARHLKRLHKQATGLDRPTREYIRAVGEWFRARLWLFDLVGVAKLDRLLEVFAYAARRYGVRHFVIDSLMMIDVPQDGPGAITKQNEAVQKLVSFKKTHNVHVHLVAHPRKLRDESEAPGKMEVAGAGGIVNGADNVFSIWRAQKDEAPANPNDPEAVAKWQEEQQGIDAKLILFTENPALMMQHVLMHPQFTPIKADALIAADGGELVQEATMPAVFYAMQALHIAGMMIRDARDPLTVTLPVKLRAYPLELFDSIWLTLARYGWATKEFVILGRSLGAGGRIQLTLKETAAGIFERGASFPPQGYAPNTNLPRPWDIQPPQIVSIHSGESELTMGTDGSIVNNVRVSWLPHTATRRPRRAWWGLMPATRRR